MKRPFIVAFTGAQGVGKTTLISDVAEKLKLANGINCQVLRGIGARAAMTGVALGQRADADTILEFARLHVIRERDLINNEVYLLDRCFIDLLVYAEMQCKDNRRLCQLIKELAISSLERIDKVVLVGSGDTQIASISMNEDTDYRSRFGFEIEKAASEFRNVFPVTGSKEIRSRTVVDMILNELRRIRN